MSESHNTTFVIDSLLKEIHAGDEKAIDELVTVAHSRLLDLCSRILGRMVGANRPDVRRSDVYQEVYFRLKNALTKDNVNPKTAGEFMGLAAQHIRFQLLDLLRKSKSNNKEVASDTILNLTPDDTGDRNEKFEMWICFYEAFESLPEEQKRVADLLWTWVEGKGGPATPKLSQYEAAEVLGIPRDRVKDLWRSARIAIARKCKDFSPF